MLNSQETVSKNLNLLLGICNYVNQTQEDLRMLINMIKFVLKDNLFTDDKRLMIKNKYLELIEKYKTSHPRLSHMLNCDVDIIWNKPDVENEDCRVNILYMYYTRMINHLESYMVYTRVTHDDILDIKRKLEDFEG